MSNLVLSLTLLLILFKPFQALCELPDDPNSEQQDSISKWSHTFRPQLILNQLSLTNWASGGESSISAKGNILYRSIFCHKSLTFSYENKFAFGIVGYSNKRIEKTEDRMDINLSFSLRASDKWSYSSMLTFKSQFANGYKYPNDSTLISAFMAPGYLNASLGFKYKPADNLDIFISPSSGKFTFVLNQELANKGAFGVRKAERDTLNNIITKGKNILSEFGINFLANYTKDIAENIELNTTLNLYNNYLDDNASNRWNIDVDWETSINFSINKFLQTVFLVHLKYDHNVKFPTYETVDGSQVLISEGPKVQLMESIGIAFTYKI